MPDLVSDFADSLRSMSVRFQSVASQSCASHDTLSKQELSALGVLGVCGPLSMGALAEHLGVGRSAVTPLVDRLEEEGAVRRRRSQADRRVWLAELTAAGDAVFQADRVAYEQVAGALLATLDPDDQRTLVTLMQRVGSAIAADPVDGVPTPLDA